MCTKYEQDPLDVVVCTAVTNVRGPSTPVSQYNFKVTQDLKNDIETL